MLSGQSDSTKRVRLREKVFEIKSPVFSHDSRRFWRTNKGSKLCCVIKWIRYTKVINSTNTSCLFVKCVCDRNCCRVINAGVVKERLKMTFEPFLIIIKQDLNRDWPAINWFGLISGIVPALHSFQLSIIQYSIGYLSVQKVWISLKNSWYYKYIYEFRFMYFKLDILFLF